MRTVGTEGPVGWLIVLLMLLLVGIVIFGVVMIIRHWRDQ